MKKIFFNGYYGYSNAGDDSFIEVAAWGGKNIWNVNSLFFHTPNHHKHPQIQHHATFYKNFYFKGSYRLQKIYQLQTSKYFVSAGGSIFNRELPNNDIKSIIKGLNKKKITGAIAVSIGPFGSKKDETSIKRYLQSLNFLTVRDKRSLEACQAFDLPFEPVLAADLAALLPEIYKEKKFNKKKEKVKCIGISYCKYETYINGDTKNELIRENQLLMVLNKLIKDPNIELSFLILNNHPTLGDYPPAINLIAKLYPARKNQIKIIPYDRCVYNSWNNLKSFDLMICTRLHAAIFSCFSGIPFFLFEYHPKCTDFANDVGIHSTYRINKSNFDLEKWLDSILKLLFNGEYIIPSNLDVVRKRAFLNFESTKSFFN